VVSRNKRIAYKNVRGLLLPAVVQEVEEKGYGSFVLLNKHVSSYDVAFITLDEAVHVLCARIYAMKRERDLHITEYDRAIFSSEGEFVRAHGCDEVLLSTCKAENRLIAALMSKYIADVVVTVKSIKASRSGTYIYCSVSKVMRKLSVDDVLRDADILKLDLSDWDSREVLLEFLIHATTRKLPQQHYLLLCVDISSKSFMLINDFNAKAVSVSDIDAIAMYSIQSYDIPVIIVKQCNVHDACIIHHDFDHGMCYAYDYVRYTMLKNRTLEYILRNVEQYMYERKLKVMRAMREAVAQQAKEDDVIDVIEEEPF